MPLIDLPDQLWFVPVCGGSRTPVGASHSVASASAAINVQWHFNRYLGVTPQIQVTAETDFAGPDGHMPRSLVNCHGRWKWNSAYSCAEDQAVSVGKLSIGTVFGLELAEFSIPEGTNDIVGIANNHWHVVETWVKYRVNIPSRFSHIWFTINGETGGPVSGLSALQLGNWLKVTNPMEWRVAYAKWGPGDWEGWSFKNLRAVLTVMGTRIDEPTGTYGESIVDVEWFAFRLSDGHRAS